MYSFTFKAEGESYYDRRNNNHGNFDAAISCWEQGNCVFKQINYEKTYFDCSYYFNPIWYGYVDKRH